MNNLTSRIFLVFCHILTWGPPWRSKLGQGGVLSQLEHQTTHRSNPRREFCVCFCFVDFSHFHIRLYYFPPLHEYCSHLSWRWNSRHWHVEHSPHSSLFCAKTLLRFASNSWNTFVRLGQDSGSTVHFNYALWGAQREVKSMVFYHTFPNL